MPPSGTVPPSPATPSWLADAVAAFGESCQRNLSGGGEPEAAIRTPLEVLLGKVGERLGVPAIYHAEYRLTDRQVRPDYAVSVAGAITGYVEVKAPGRPISPTALRGHDLAQWERQCDLPNLLYTNGTEWRLYVDGEAWGQPVKLTGDLATAGAELTAPPALEAMLTAFLRWEPADITSVGGLVRAIAPLTRLLRGEVLDQLSQERRAIAEGADPETQPFLGLAQDWRALLFPQADDATFADGYAQAVTFALLLARTEDIDLTGSSLHTIGARLGADHSLMGRALQLLTESVADDFKVTLDLLVRVIGAVQWPRVRAGRRDTYLHLYEHFLDLYDNELRKKSGSYYTPRPVAEQMVRLTEQALTTRLGKTAGFRDESVVTVDPAMGTGTYLHTILEHVAKAATAVDGPGAAAGAATAVARRLVGFELQMGPYAVAELRTADLLASLGAAVPDDGMRLYVTDTLDDPHAAQTQLGSGLRFLAQSRRQANDVKASEVVTVVIGNPPYKELANGDGGWVEQGSGAHGDRSRAILEDFFDPAANRFKAKLKNLYVYFWRWATWKVWESTPADTAAEASDNAAGVVCFISTSGYLTGPAFTGMRRYLRQHATEGWIIDLTPEGQTPDVPTRIFPGVRQPLAIGLFVRTRDSDPSVPATIKVRSLHGRQSEKFDALATVNLDDDGWQLARADWAAPFTPAAASGWDDYPALDDLMPWYSPGVFPTRGWVSAPSSRVLERRWRTLIAETDPAVKSELFKEGRDANLRTGRQPLPGVDTHSATTTPLSVETSSAVRAVRYGYRAFDRQWLIPDHRVMDMPRRDLWSARIPGQVFVSELHTRPVLEGPGLAFSSLIPDFHYFKGSEGGRTLPALHPNGTPNLAPGLSESLTALLGRAVTASDVLAYIAAVTAHDAFTTTFTDELRTPGIRIPITADPGLFDEAVELGEQVLWLHTYGERFTGENRPAGSVRFSPGDERQPLSQTPITGMPETIAYDSERQVVAIGDGEFGPVPPAVWAYSVGGRDVIKSWFAYRKANPGGRKSSPLDDIHPATWEPEWTPEFVDLLTVLRRLVDLAPQQADLLDRVLAGVLLTRDELAAAGVSWPSSAADRRPRSSLALTVATLL